MTRDERAEAGRIMLSAITSQIKNPAGWLLAVRRICERIGLNPASAIRLGDVSLADVVYGVITEANSNGCNMSVIQNAIEDLEGES